MILHTSENNQLMKRKSSMFFNRNVFFILTICSLLTLAFRSSNNDNIQEINDNYNRNFQAFYDQINDYLVLAQDSVNRNADNLKSAQRATRLAYKKIEYLLTVYEEDYVKWHINGAPLPRVEGLGHEVIVIEPEGLQLLDELVYEDSLDYDFIEEKLINLKGKVAKLLPYEKSRTFDRRYIIEAMRTQIVRIMSLGITGFDTPGSLNGIEESRVAIQQLYKDVGHFESSIKSSDRSVLLTLERKLKGAGSYLTKNNDFNTFDRFIFIKEYLNPIHQYIRDLHYAMDISHHNEITRPLQSTLYDADNPWKKDYFNAYFFASLFEKDDNEALRRLGSFLFFEPALSKNNEMSCGTCHQADKAFADGLAKSITNQADKYGLRNTPTIINAIYSTRHFHDLRANRLENQVLNVMENPLEFNTNFDEVVTKLKQSEEYINLFKEAFQFLPKSETLIDRSTISTALKSYIISLRSLNSPFDQYMRDERENIPGIVKDGFNLFMGKAACGTCHFAPLFNGLVPPDFHENESEVLGVPSDKKGKHLDSDAGRIENKFRFDEVEHFRHSFKTVSVRNISETAPYMHNGIYDSLEQVIEFYDVGGGIGLGLDVPFQTLSADSLHLSEYEKKSLISFMESLTDVSFDRLTPEVLPNFNEDSPLSNISRMVEY